MTLWSLVGALNFKGGPGTGWPPKPWPSTGYSTLLEEVVTTILVEAGFHYPDVNFLLYSSHKLSVLHSQDLNQDSCRNIWIMWAKIVKNVISGAAGCVLCHDNMCASLCDITHRCHSGYHYKFNRNEIKCKYLWTRRGKKKKKGFPKFMRYWKDSKDATGTV